MNRLNVSTEQTMSILKALIVFYQKLIIPTLLFSIMANLVGTLITGAFRMEVLGVSNVIISLLFQYFIYDLVNPNEYYFYFNIGLNKYILWASNLVSSLIICILLSLI